MAECCCHHYGKIPWYKNKLYWIFIALFVVLEISYVVPFLDAFRVAFYDYTAQIWWAILLGLILGGVIDYFVPTSLIKKLLSQKKKRTIITATLVGFLLSACSHGILALAIQLYKKGASVPAVISFLLASPWANLPVTIMLFGLFGWKAFVLIVSAMIIAVITGLIFQVLDHYHLIEGSFPTPKETKKKEPKTAKNIVKGVWKGTKELSDMVLWWMVIGMIMAAFARAYIPTHLFQQYMGATILGLIITLVIATIIEVCSEGSAPLAFEIFNQTGAFGNAFAFLMAGVATDYTEVGLLWVNIGRRTALWLVAITVPQIILLAWLFNVFL